MTASLSLESDTIATATNSTIDQLGETAERLKASLYWSEVLHSWAKIDTIASLTEDIAALAMEWLEFDIASAANLLSLHQHHHNHWESSKHFCRKDCWSYFDC